MIMLWTIGIGLGFVVAERVWPDQALPHSPNWWARAVGFNLAGYGRFGGAYNRRNAYGAVFSHGPVLEQAGETDILDAVMTYTFCGQSPLLSAMNLDANATKVVAESRAHGDPNPPWPYAVDCP